ncbi:GRIP and coiled-coil domain-containing protein-like [Hydra vulgaris]|uniref:GRIP and coiled-coil domain-containing protein-like n=1 Tax=Hydra vulgaris TaxID=6087 RepID=A0ABM4DB17_HYDVU
MIKIFPYRFFHRDDEKKMGMISQNQSLKEDREKKHDFKMNLKKNKVFKLFERNKVHPAEESKILKYEPSDAREVEKSIDSSINNTFQQEKKKKNKKINFWKLFHQGYKTKKEKKKKNVESKSYQNIFENFIKNDGIDTIDSKNLIENDKIDIIDNESCIENDGFDSFDKENFIENDKIKIIDNRIFSENDNDLSFDSFYSSLDEIYMDSITYLSQIDSFDLFEKEKGFEIIHDVENVESLNIENINQSSSYTFSDSDDEFVSDFVNDDVLNSTLQLTSFIKEIRNNSTSVINTSKNLFHCENNKKELLQCEINKQELVHCEINKIELLQCENNEKELLQCENETIEVLQSEINKKEVLQCMFNMIELLQCEIDKKELLQCEINKKELLHCENNEKNLLHCEIIKKNKSLKTMREFALCELDEVLNETELEIKEKYCCSNINMCENVAKQQKTI